jgi:hypothetical protein
VGGWGEVSMVEDEGYGCTEEGALRPRGAGGRIVGGGVEGGGGGEGVEVE